MTAPHHADTRDDSKHVVAVYPGTFDPITNGHLDILERALAMFDQIIVTIALNVRKQPLFDVEERIGFIRDAIPGHAARVEFASFDGLLVEFCKSRGARVIVRGLRAMADFEYEFQFAHMNRRLAPEIDTVFFMTDERNRPFGILLEQTREERRGVRARRKQRLFVNHLALKDLR